MVDGLTPREIQILQELAHGHDEAMVAAQLSLRVGTMRATAYGAMVKLGATSRLHACCIALRMGIIE